MTTPSDPGRADAGNREVVDAFRNVIEQLWAGLVALIGDTSTVALFQSAQQDATRRYPFLGSLDVDNTGVRLDRLRVNVMGMQRSTLRAGTLAFIETLEKLVVDLTGDVVMRKVEPHIQRFKNAVDKE